MTEQAVGFLVPDGKGYKVICNECKAQSTLYSHLETPIFVVNLGQYQQHCFRCDKDLNPHAHPQFPELFDGK